MWCRLNLQCVTVVFVFILLFIEGKSWEQPKPCSASNFEKLTVDSSTDTNRLLTLVSTLDGKLTALGDTGKVEWTVQTDGKPLLSSSISKYPVSRNGMMTRLIPSLDGGLYQFDGENVEPVPFTADTLLSHSFRFNDDSTIVGGKDSETYGLNARSGKVRYVCNSGGCEGFDTGEEIDLNETDEVLLLTRQTKTVRAVQMRTGAEKWNFSVAEYDISYVSHSKRNIGDLITSESGEASTKPSGSCKSSNAQEQFKDVLEALNSAGLDVEPSTEQEEEDDEVTVDACDSPEDFEFPWWNDEEAPKFEIKVTVPTGVIVAVNKEDAKKIVWKYKFDTPIANAWTLQAGGHLEKLDLFDAQYVPALSFEPDDQAAGEMPPVPALYIGLHEHQLYVQPSVQIIHAFEDSIASAMASGQLISMPHIKWRPYMASASSRTPALTERMTPHHVTWDKSGEAAVTSSSSELAIWQEDYPYDPGYYLYYERKPIKLPDIPPPGFLDTPISVTLWNWWKEVLAICIVTSMLTHFVIVKIFYRHAIQITNQNVEQSNETTPQQETKKESSDFVSRYYSDFDQVEVLGKGGFGVVYHARNRLDDCDYAIKRVTLRNSHNAREKVGREVKALAKLDHVGIVRYYQAWFETPPADVPIVEATDSTTGPATFSQNTANVTSAEGLTDINKRSNMFMFGGGDSSDMFSQQQLLHEGSSTGFLPPKTSRSFETKCETQDDSSIDIIFSNNSENSQTIDSSYSKSNNRISHENRGKYFCDDSLDIVFENEENSNDSETNGDKNDSLDIVFENEENSNENETNCDSKSEEVHKKCKPTSDGSSTSKTVPSKARMSPKSPQRLYLYIQMQLCKKESLKDWLAENTLNRARHHSLDVFEQIVAAVDYVHQCGLMHRDLKPSNIFFSLDGTVKVGDFGLATEVYQSDSSSSSTERDDHTDQVGTKLYMSPEQIAGRPYTNKVDIYALGLILFELMYPFATMMERGRTITDVKACNFPPRFSRELPDECSLVRQLLNMIPRERPSADEILAHHLLMEVQDKRRENARLKITRNRTRSSASSSSMSSVKDENS